MITIKYNINNYNKEFDGSVSMEMDTCDGRERTGLQKCFETAVQKSL